MATHLTSPCSRFPTNSPSFPDPVALPEAPLYESDHVVPSNTVIDVDAQVEDDKKPVCKGIVMSFPEGESHHTSYLFGLHAKLHLP